MMSDHERVTALRPVTVSLLSAISAAAIASVQGSGGGTDGAHEIAEKVTHSFLDQLSTSAPAAMHVMVVDDDKFIRDTVSRMVRLAFLTH